MTRTHHYRALVSWTSDGGAGTTGYRDYTRDHDIAGVDTPGTPGTGTSGKPLIRGTADPAFHGRPDAWNPEELLVVSLSQCHMLWYLALCAQAGIVVTAYRDRPSGAMFETAEGSGAFTEVTLNPEVTISTPSAIEMATELHRKAHEMCFIANSVNFPVHHAPVITVA